MRISMGSDKNGNIAGMNRKTYLRDVNPYLICPLCRGYLVDATTVVECLHSFCRSCILKHLKNEAHCPSCKNILNKAKPNIKADKALQDIVYKLVPGLYHKEMRRRKEFYMKHPEHGSAVSLNHLGGAEKATPEQRGEDAASSRLFFAPEDAVSLSLEYLPPGVDPIDADASYNNTDLKKSNGTTNRRYLQCPALVTIAHLKKFLALKYNVDITRYNIDICHRRAPLPEYLTLMDVAYIYAWKRNAPMRFFYTITKEEQQLEAPPNDRPSTPGLGATFPPVDEQGMISQNVKASSTEDISGKNEDMFGKDRVSNSEQKAWKTEESVKELKDESTEKGLAQETNKQTITEKEVIQNQSDANVLVKEEIVNDEKELTKTTIFKDKLMSQCESLANKIKSPIKILKNSDGSYEVKSSSQNNSGSDLANAESKNEKAEFSIVSLNNSPNSNGVKMTLKQCSPGNTGSKKPKVISNVLLRSPDEKSLSIFQQIKEINKASAVLKKDEESKPSEVEVKDNVEVTEKGDKIKRKVSFSDKSQEPVQKKVKFSEEQKIKKEFLQSFELAATEDCKNELKGNAKLLKKEDPSKACTSPEKQKGSLLESKSDINTSSKSNNPATNKNVDVYAFPNEPPPMAGAVKRKCPPGLVITDMTKKSTQELQKMKTNFINTPKSYRKMMKETKPVKQVANAIKPPMSLADTRNLLDECGLNIPAGLSITLASSKPSTNYNYTTENTTTMKLAVKSADRLNQSIVELHKPKTGFAKTPAPDIIPISNQDGSKLRGFKPESQDALDLSNSRGPPVPTSRAHRLPKVPLPIIKPQSAAATLGNHASLSKKGQVVTLVGGQKYYRAPPGSLTPAAHRVTEYNTTSTGRTPVYAPNLLGASSNLSSAFPTLQSLYVQYQRDRFKHSPQDIPTKTHLMAQCPPAKPARSSLVVPKQQPSNGHLYIKKVLANDARMANNKHVTFEKPSSVSQTPSSSASISKDVCSPSDRSAASPRVSSTVSPSPPPIAPPTNDVTESKASADKSPESPDSSSVIENKPSDNKREKLEQEKKEQKQLEEDFQKRLLAAFPSKEWSSNPICQEHLDNLIKNLKNRVENKESSNVDKQEEQKEVKEKDASAEGSS